MSTELKPENEDEDDGPQCETGTKPCPFCGNTNVEQFTHRTCEVVICPKCSMYSYGGTPHHKWQNRTPDPRVKELEEFIKRWVKHSDLCIRGMSYEPHTGCSCDLSEAVEARKSLNL